MHEHQKGQEMTPTETLRHEHDIILLVLGGIERGAGSLLATLAVDPEWLDTIVDFAANFVDRCHHGKEEKHLFVKLAEQWRPGEIGPIGVLLREHEGGRAFIRAIAEATPDAKTADAGALAAARDGLRAYVSLMRAHIAKENDVLFVMVDEVLTPEDQTELEAAFERVEAEDLGEGTHERYHRLAHELAEH
jgi:hemerythrin-like domain-containing protein